LTVDVKKKELKKRCRKKQKRERCEAQANDASETDQNPSLTSLFGWTWFVRKGEGDSCHGLRKGGQRKKVKRPL